MRRSIALPAAALLAALALQGCARPSQYVEACREEGGGRYTEEMVRQCAQGRADQRNLDIGQSITTGMVGVLAVPAIMAAPTAACSTVSRPSGSGYQTSTICY